MHSLIFTSRRERLVLLRFTLLLLIVSLQAIAARRGNISSTLDPEFNVQPQILPHAAVADLFPGYECTWNEPGAIEHIGREFCEFAKNEKKDYWCFGAVMEAPITAGGIGKRSRKSIFCPAIIGIGGEARCPTADECASTSALKSKASTYLYAWVVNNSPMPVTPDLNSICSYHSLLVGQKSSISQLGARGSPQNIKPKERSGQTSGRVLCSGNVTCRWANRKGSTEEKDIEPVQFSGVMCSDPSDSCSEKPFDCVTKTGFLNPELLKKSLEMRQKNRDVYQKFLRDKSQY